MNADYFCILQYYKVFLTVVHIQVMTWYTISFIIICIFLRHIYIYIHVSMQMNPQAKTLTNDKNFQPWNWRGVSTTLICLTYSCKCCFHVLSDAARWWGCFRIIQIIHLRHKVSDFDDSHEKPSLQDSIMCVSGTTRNSRWNPSKNHYFFMPNKYIYPFIVMSWTLAFINRNVILKSLWSPPPYLIYLNIFCLSNKQISIL